MFCIKTKKADAVRLPIFEKWSSFDRSNKNSYQMADLQKCPSSEVRHVGGVF